MADYIKREDARTLLFDRLIETANNNTGYQCDSGVVYQDAAERLRLCWLNEVPGADVVERKHGKWIINGNDAMCSNCNDIFCGDWADVDLIADCDMNFCPNCGAQMESGDSDV